jgi:hypothetical protein
MTKIYIYCLFDRYDNFLGVYSSLQAINRDAMKLCNTGASKVWLLDANTKKDCTLVNLRNTFKGKCDYEIKYASSATSVKIFKTKLKE